MRQHLHIARSRTGRIAAALVAIVTVTGCGARIAPSPVGAGYSSDLINTPICAVDEEFGEGSDCGTFGWAEGRLYRPVP